MSVKLAPLNLTDQQHANLRELADRRFSTVSQVARQLLEESIDREKRDEEHTDAR
jgi:predicted transcriptional regulator